MPYCNGPFYVILLSYYGNSRACNEWVYQIHHLRVQEENGPHYTLVDIPRVSPHSLAETCQALGAILICTGPFKETVSALIVGDFPPG